MLEDRLNELSALKEECYEDPRMERLINILEEILEELCEDSC